MVTVRPATAADGPAVGAVQVRTWQAAYEGKMPADYLAGLDAHARGEFWTRVATTVSDPATLLVADIDGTVAGFVSCGRYRPVEAVDGPGAAVPETVGEVAAIYVAREHWSTGAGLALMRAAIEHLTARGFTDIRLWVLDTNERARRFYERFGYATDGGEQLDDGFAGMPPLREVRYVLRLG